MPWHFLQFPCGSLTLLFWGEHGGEVHVSIVGHHRQGGSWIVDVSTPWDMECIVVDDFFSHWKDGVKSFLMQDSKGHLWLWFWINHVANSVKFLGIFWGAWVAAIAVAGHQVALLDPTREDLIFKTASYLWLQLNQKSLPFLPLSKRHLETARNHFFFHLGQSLEAWVTLDSGGVQPPAGGGTSCSIRLELKSGRGTFISFHSGELTTCRIHCTKPCCWSIGGFLF